jgi:hypothetical protein
MGNEMNLLDIYAQACLDIGYAVRETINSMPFGERGIRTTSILKPEAQGRATQADAKGEEEGVKVLDMLSKEIGHNIFLIVNPSNGSIYKIGSSASDKVVFAYMDAVDGTWKVAGIGGPKYQANDGNWGTGVALTMPTSLSLEELTIGDFKTAAITTGNPRKYACAPDDVFASPDENGNPISYSVALGSGAKQEIKRVYTSTQSKLGQSFGYYDAFQGFDRQTAPAGTEDLTAKLWRLLENRNEGGCFDLIRSYGNLSACACDMLGWRDESLPESAAGIFVALNESLPNLIPAVPIIIGAGGIALDFEGNPLQERKLTAPRTNIIYIANQALKEQVMPLIEKAME